MSLHRVAQRDVADRGLSSDTKAAVSLMGSHAGRAQRSVVAEMLGRALFLHKWVNKHPHIAGYTTLAELTDRAKGILQDLSLDDRTLASLGWMPRLVLFLPAGWRRRRRIVQSKNSALSAMR